MKTSSFVASIVLAAAMAIGGCSNNKSESKTAVSSSAAAQNCPYSGNPANLSVTRDYKGKKVAFCCNGCAARWDKATDAERDAQLSMKK